MSKLPAIRGARAIVQRRVEPPGGLEYFPTPPWATRALVHHVLPMVLSRAAMRRLARQTAWEPACGEGHMAAVLEESFRDVKATDVFPYGFGGVRDFLDEMYETPLAADWIITNPPFEKVTEFTRLALDRASHGVAMFVRPTALEGVGRYRKIFRERPPALVAQFVERVPIHKGRWEPDGSTATSYCWVVWLTDAPHPTRFGWIPPQCRKSLARAGDVERFGARPEPAACPLLEGTV